MLFNGELTKQATNVAKGGFIDRVARVGDTPQDSLNELFMAGLARRRSDEG